MLSPLHLVVLGLLLAERAVELLIHRRNARRLREQGALWLGADGFALIVAAQVVLFAGVAAEGWLAPWSRTPAPALALALVVALALAQALRYWCITTLGERWSIRVVTLPGAPRVTRGPYALFPHPNYVAVMVEAVALPLLLGAYATFFVAAPLQLLAIWRRVRLEERALREAAQVKPT